MIESLVDAAAVLREMQMIVAYAGAKNSAYARLLATDADGEMLRSMLGEACAYAHGMLGGGVSLPSGHGGREAFAARLQTALAHYAAGLWMQQCSWPGADAHFRLAERELGCARRIQERDTRPIPPL